MDGQHIAIFTLAVKSHIYPPLGFCPELVRRGYRITYATDIYHAPLVQEAGIEAVIFKPAKLDPTGDMEELFRLPLSRRPLSRRAEWATLANITFPWLISNAAVMVSQLHDFYEGNRPDLVIYDRDTYAGRIFAEQLGCPAIQLLPHFTYHKSSLHWDNGVSSMPEAMLEFARILDSFLWAYGITGRDSLWHMEKLNLCLIPKVFQYDADSFDCSTCFVGPCLERPFTPSWERRSNGKPVILISDVTGSADVRYYKVLTDALSGLEYQVILSVDDNFPDNSLPALPANFEVNRHGSHLELLPHAALMISQGGMGGTLAAICHGVPVIAFPPSLRHEEVAYRVAELGLGLNIPRKTMTAGVIRDAVEKVLGDASLLSRIKQMQHVFRSCGGAAIAANKIEEFLENRLEV